MPNKTVCMLSCHHDLYDDRIYWKESLSLKKAGYEVVHIGVGSENLDVVSEHGIQLQTVKKHSFFKNPFIDKAFRKTTLQTSVYGLLLQKAKETNANVFHLHDLQLIRLVKKLKSLPQQPKVVYDAHEPYPITIAQNYSKYIVGNLFWKLYSRHIHRWEISKSKKCDLIISTEENVRDKFANAHPEVPVEVIYNYVDTKPLPEAEKYRYDFIYCGGIRKRRGVFEMLNGIRSLKKEKQNVKLLLIGSIHDPGLRAQIINFINENNLAENIILKDSVPYAHIKKYYQLSRIGFAIFDKSKVNKTIMPIKIFEYIVFGLPVITSNFGHMYRITKEHSTGICVDPEDKEQIYSAMRQLLLNNETYAKYRNNCKVAAKLFDWEAMEKKLLNLYSDLLA
jgi:glycosyltransferase involved in cell wall biosynthesis